MGVVNLPNIFTITRILLLPFFAITLIYGHHRYSLAIFIAAGLTDVLDGLLARAKNQTTSFGSILDPVADKFLLLTSLIIMSIYEWIPKWLTITVISRDLIVVTGWLILYFATHTARVEPSILGKGANALQFILVGIVLLSINLTGTPYAPMGILIAIAVLTSLSGLHYIYRGLKIANGI
ncbi:MAG: CDP-alcohol phosphatidyltransferase family protein [Nitrospirae bacterium]|nr:CDP-alcohol phosphatidyltransferase family protein [Nitrospirota bacterium]